MLGDMDPDAEQRERDDSHPAVPGHATAQCELEVEAVDEQNNHEHEDVANKHTPENIADEVEGHGSIPGLVE